MSAIPVASPAVGSTSGSLGGGDLGGSALLDGADPKGSARALAVCNASAATSPAAMKRVFGMVVLSGNKASAMPRDAIPAKQADDGGGKPRHRWRPATAVKSLPHADAVKGQGAPW